MTPAPSTAPYVERTVSDLLSEIARMRTMIVFYENQIIRKEIAVQELLQTHDANSITQVEINEETLTNRFQ